MTQRPFFSIIIQLWLRVFIKFLTVILILISHKKFVNYSL